MKQPISDLEQQAAQDYYCSFLVKAFSRQHHKEREPKQNTRLLSGWNTSELREAEAVGDYKEEICGKGLKRREESYIKRAPKICTGVPFICCQILSNIWNSMRWGKKWPGSFKLNNFHCSTEGWETWEFWPVRGESPSWTTKAINRDSKRVVPQEWG